MSFLVEILIEFGIQFVFEMLAELGAHSFRRNQKPVHPIIAGFGYVLLGVFLGWASCLVFPQNMISHEYIQIANLVLTPVGVGLVFGAIGSWRSKQGMELVRLDKFTFGYAFALAFALSRFALSHT